MYREPFVRKQNRRTQKGLSHAVNESEFKALYKVVQERYHHVALKECVKHNIPLQVTLNLLLPHFIEVGIKISFP